MLLQCTLNVPDGQSDLLYIAMTLECFETGT